MTRTDNGRLNRDRARRYNNKDDEIYEIPTLAAAARAGFGSTSCARRQIGWTDRQIGLKTSRKKKKSKTDLLLFLSPHAAEHPATGGPSDRRRSGRQESACTATTTPRVTCGPRSRRTVSAAETAKLRGNVAIIEFGSLSASRAYTAHGAAAARTHRDN